MNKIKFLRKKTKDILCRSSIGVWIYETLYLKFVRVYYKRKSCRRLQRYGGEILKQVEAALREEKIPYFLDYGTLLGCVRENHFIAHDNDIDYGILASYKNMSRLTTCLLANGFSFVRAFLFEDKITEITFERYGIHIDFFVHTEEDNKLWAHYYEVDVWLPTHKQKEPANLIIRTYRPLIPSFVEQSFCGVKVFIPTNYDEVLCAHYGRGWRVPNAAWDRSEEGDYCIKTEIKNKSAYVIGLTELIEFERNCCGCG